MEAFDQLQVLLNNLEEITKCAVCLEGLGEDVLQCVSGHGTCARCRRRILVCPICKGFFLSNKPIMLVQMLEALPKLCDFKSKGCKAVSFSRNHELSCEHRQFHCIIGKPNECQWTGLVKDFGSHVLGYHNNFYTSYPVEQPRKLHYKDFKANNWTTHNYLHTVENHIFLLHAHKDLAKRRFVQVVKHIPLGESNETFYFVLTFAKKHLIFKHTIKACHFLENEKFENDPFCMIVPLEELDVFLDSSTRNLEVTFEALKY